MDEGGGSPRRRVGTRVPGLRSDTTTTRGVSSLHLLSSGAGVVVPTSCRSAQLAIHRRDRHPQIANPIYRDPTDRDTVVACSPSWPIWPSRAGAWAAPPPTGPSACGAGACSADLDRTARTRPQRVFPRWRWRRSTPGSRGRVCWPTRSGVAVTSRGRWPSRWRRRSRSWGRGRCGSSRSRPPPRWPAAAAASTCSGWPGVRRASCAAVASRSALLRSWSWPRAARTPPSSPPPSAGSLRRASSSPGPSGFSGSGRPGW